MRVGLPCHGLRRDRRRAAMPLFFRRSARGTLPIACAVLQLAGCLESTDSSLGGAPPHAGTTDAGCLRHRCVGVPRHWVRRRAQGDRRRAATAGESAAAGWRPGAAQAGPARAAQRSQLRRVARDVYRRRPAAPWLPPRFVSLERVGRIDVGRAELFGQLRVVLRDQRNHGRAELLGKLHWVSGWSAQEPSHLPLQLTLG